MNSKRVASAVVGLALAAQTFMPLAASAQDARGRDTATTTRRGGAFCDRISAFSAQYDQRLGDRNDRLADRRGSRSDRREIRRDEHSKRREGILEKRDEKRDNALDRLLEANPDAGPAIVAFKTAMEEAFADRREAIDAARDAFQGGIDVLISERRAASDSAVATLQASIKAAFDKAKSDCAAGIDAETVKEDLMASLRKAQQAFKDARKSAINQADRMRNLVEVRRAAFEDAREAFHAAAEEARADLKNALAELQTEEGDEN